MHIYSNESAGLYVVAPTFRADGLDSRVIRRGVQDVVISEIDRHMPDSFHSRIVLPDRIGEIDAVSPTEFGTGHVPIEVG